jgi:DNA repair exonuclease SbcCD ATPase subunit
MSKTIKVVEATVISTRTPDIIAAEINGIKDQTARVFFFNSIEIGRKLVEAKTYVDHGGWANWLKESVDFSQSTANNHMKMFTEYGADQMALFGENVKSQVFAKLSYSQAVALLAIPADEREEFVESNDVKDMSVRELQQAIKDKEELENTLEEAREDLRQEQKSLEQEQEARQALFGQYQTELKLRQDQEKQLNDLLLEFDKAQESGDNKSAAKTKTEMRAAEKAASDIQIKLDGLEKQLESQKAEHEKAITERLQQREQELNAEAKIREDTLQEQLSKLDQQLKRSNNESFLKAKMQLQQIITQGDVLVKAIAEVSDPGEQEKLKAAAVQVVDKLRALL